MKNSPAAAETAAPASTGKIRRYLRAQAHALKPVVKLGKEGLKPSALAEVERALASHELIKVHCAGDKATKQAIAAEIEKRLGAFCAGIVGHTLTLYQQHEEPKKRRYRLPD
jgi:RNA-binding protein